MASVIVIPTARPTFVIGVAQERAKAARALLEELGADVHGPSELVMSPEDIENARPYLDTAADLVINVCASFSDATPALSLYAGMDRPLLLWSFREPGPVGDRLWLNSMCGANLFGHALRRNGKKVHLLYGDPSEDRVRQQLVEILAGRLPAAPVLPTEQRERGDREEVRDMLSALDGRRIGIIGEAPAGFTPSDFDPELVKSLFGLEVDPISVEDAFRKIGDVADTERQAEFDAVVASRPTLNQLDGSVVAGHAAITAALRTWSKKDQLSAVAVRCWPEFPTELGVCPCSSLSRIADEGIPTVCERDVYGAVTMMLCEALGSGTTYLVDTVDLDQEKNIVRLWHCGSAATSLAADPDNATQSVHCNRKIGVAGNFALKTGPVVMARLTEQLPDGANPGGLRLLIASGESVPAPNRFQGNTADVRMDTDAAEFVNGLVTGGFPHHTVMAWTDVRPQLRAAADLLDIPVIEW